MEGGRGTGRTEASEVAAYLRDAYACAAGEPETDPDDADDGGTMKAAPADGGDEPPPPARPALGEDAPVKLRMGTTVQGQRCLVVFHLDAGDLRAAVMHIPSSSCTWADIGRWRKLPKQAAHSMVALRSHCSRMLRSMHITFDRGSLVVAVRNPRRSLLATVPGMGDHLQRIAIAPGSR